MKSPFTGGEVELVLEAKQLEFRKESFEIIHHSWKCKDTGEFFTTDELSQINLTQVHNKYREKHRLPFPDQIRMIREKYDLSATRMSELLGFGVNTYRNYENGEVPQASNGKLIKLADSPEEFKRLVEISDALTDRESSRILSRVERLMDEERQSNERKLKQLLSDKSWFPNVYTGYREMRFQKLCHMIVFFAEQLRPYKTKLNKLLFYADFLNYKTTGYSISGSNYVAIELGPVPDGYDMLFDFFHRNESFLIEYHQFEERENIGERFIPNPLNAFDEKLFDRIELENLSKVSETFKNVSTQDLIELSHKETAWRERANDKKPIEYDYAFELSIG